MSFQRFIHYKEFENVDIRIGTVIEAFEYNELKKPSIILKTDFGEKVGIKKTSAQLQKYYKSAISTSPSLAAAQEKGESALDFPYFEFRSSWNQP